MYEFDGEIKEARCGTPESAEKGTSLMTHASIATIATTITDCPDLAAQIESAAAAAHAERIAAAALTAPRFRGRAECLRLSDSYGSGAPDPTALLALEAPDGTARERLAATGALSPAVLGALGNLPALERRRERAERQLHGDSLLARPPGCAGERALRVIAAREIRRAEFRRATHDHTTMLRIVAEGAEGASSQSDRISSSAAGMCGAYCRVAYSVASSTHTYAISRALLDTPRERRVSGGYLYLSPTCRVRQGRGTALVCEHLSAHTRGRLVWR